MTHNCPLAAIGCFGPIPSGHAADASAAPILSQQSRRPTRLSIRRRGRLAEPSPFDAPREGLKMFRFILHVDFTCFAACPCRRSS
jgi:hypothetical protein